MSKILPYVTAAALTLGGQALAAPPAGSAPSPAATTPPAAQPTAPATAPANPATPPATAAPPAPATPPAATTPPASATPPAAASPSAPAEQQAPSTSAASPSAAAAPVKLATGQTVKDNTGTTIGQITELKTDAGGHQMATIKMGTSTFAVEASKLAVQDGSATINLSQQQLNAMIPKPKP
jgi:hypothetical protein